MMMLSQGEDVPSTTCTDEDMGELNNACVQAGKLCSKNKKLFTSLLLMTE